MFAEFEKMIKEKLSISSPSSPVDISRTPLRHSIGNQQYQQLKLLSEGSFGFIWLAEETKTKEQYALKRVICTNETSIEQAKHELNIMKSMPKHKNLVGCVCGDVVNLKGSQNKAVIIVMQYCLGGTLFNWLQTRQHRGFSEKELVSIIQAIASGLMVLHQAGYYHQDVKIQNVLLASDKTLKICDFGSCTKQLIDFSQIPTHLYASVKEEVQAATTPMYRPPQLVDPYLRYTLSPKMDIWMLGCVLYTLSYFMHPFVDSNAVGIASAVVRFPNYPEETEYRVTEKIKDFIRAMLMPNPAFRPSAEDILGFTKSWDNIDGQSLLNLEAKKRKLNEMKRNQQLTKLNKQVVEYDGDIPMQKLMELQAKMKMSEGKKKQQGSISFVTEEETKRIREGKSGIYAKRLAEVAGDKSKKGHVQSNCAKQAQQTNKKHVQAVNQNDFWNQPSTKIDSSSQKDFNLFTNFLHSKEEITISSNQRPIEVHSVSNNANFEQFFSQSLDLQAETSGKVSKDSCNLLDL